MLLTQHNKMGLLHLLQASTRMPACRLPDADITTEEEASKLEAEVQELQGEV